MPSLSKTSLTNGSSAARLSIDSPVFGVFGEDNYRLPCHSLQTTEPEASQNASTAAECNASWPSGKTGLTMPLRHPYATSISTIIDHKLTTWTFCIHLGTHRGRSITLQLGTQSRQSYALQIRPSFCLRSTLLHNLAGKVRTVP